MRGVLRILSAALKARWNMLGSAGGPGRCCAVGTRSARSARQGMLASAGGWGRYGKRDRLRRAAAAHVRVTRGRADGLGGGSWKCVVAARPKYPGVPHAQPRRIAKMSTLVAALAPFSVRTASELTVAITSPQARRAATRTAPATDGRTFSSSAPDSGRPNQSKPRYPMQRALPRCHEQ